ncbi:unnamed protein product [Rotaria sp. Silwood2]|nr:unnamed protein product [Rotaria sp. Silwood2]CAF2635202.1 unnamed protein product [Rotaria sp. Silwood2]CAF2910431.1 unnamed protein product [Rotaria sp. Silwood2]CAF4401264.1 unnamed protein product [Rotaria sp. Silwood2]
MNTLFDIQHGLNMSKTTSPLSCRFMLRRTPRRKLVFSSSDDETDDSPQSVSSVHILRQEHHSIIYDEQLSTKSEMTTSIVTRSKLEHYGFSMLARPTSLRLNKRQSLTIINQNKKTRSNEPCHSMQTRSQSSSSDSHSDHLVNLFDKTLSTVTPNPVRNRQRRYKPLPLCLSDNEKNMPVLTVITTEENSNTNKRSYIDDENSENCRAIKRSKIFNENDKENNLFVKRSRRGVGLIRSFTEPNEEQIKASVELGSNRDLIGDRTRSYLLPRCKSRKHPDLACISPETVVDILQNVYASEIENLYIIDCRYPYEYEGGHIQLAKNLYTRSQIYNEYFHKPLELRDTSKRNIFIFHCEFSSERAPSLLRFFRSEDRNIHERNYPQLHYPEIYLLEGGYKAFYEYSNQFCIPNQYRTMSDVNYQEEYRQYRFETKQFDKFTGENERIGGGRRTRGLTFRSCLSFSSQPNQYRSSNIRYDLRYIESPPEN